MHLHQLGHAHEHSQVHIHEDNIDPVLSDDSVNHTHVSNAHLSSDDSHDSHHDQVMSESDVSPNGVVSKENPKAPLLALILVLILLLQIPSKSRQARFVTGKQRRCWRPHFTPPSRAPPVTLQ